MDRALTAVAVRDGITFANEKASGMLGSWTKIFRDTWALTCFFFFLSIKKQIKI
jgi:hypothetical protein